MQVQRISNKSVLRLCAAMLMLVFCISASVSFALGPRPSPKNAEWWGETWGMVQVTPAITKPTNSVTVIAKVAWSPVLIKAMEEDDAFREEANEVIELVLPLIRH